MSEFKLKLDNSTQPALLVDLWNIEEMIENEEPVEALKELSKLIDKVRYSEIIESYKLLK